MLGKYKLIELVGSTRGDNKLLFEAAEKDLTNKGYIVFKPVLFGDEVNDSNIDMLNDMCREKLLISDAICIVTPEYYGTSTLNRINQATILNREIYMWENNILYAQYKFRIGSSRITIDQ